MLIVTKWTRSARVSAGGLTQRTAARLTPRATSVTLAGCASEHMRFIIVTTSSVTAKLCRPKWRLTLRRCRNSWVAAKGDRTRQGPHSTIGCRGASCIFALAFFRVLALTLRVCKRIQHHCTGAWGKSYRAQEGGRAQSRVYGRRADTSGR